MSTDNTKLTEKQLEELKELRAYRIDRETADKAALGILPEHEKYKVPKGEEKHAHLLIGFISKPNLHDREKDEISRTLVHKLDPRGYTNFLDNMAGMGFKIIKVLHLPKDGFVAPLAYFKAKKEAADAKAKKAKQATANADAALLLNQ